MRKPYLVLHKSEWERLHRRSDNSNQLSNQRDEYFTKLIEKSQSWIKTWPDTVQGHVEKVTREKEKRHEEDIAIGKKWLQKNKQEMSNEAIKNARQLIFEDSCYGKQLMGALMESKNLEIREIQMEFQKKIKEQTLEQEKLVPLNQDQCTFNLDKTQKSEHQKKAIEIDLAKINKLIHDTKIGKKLKIKEEQRQMEREDAQLMQQLLENEARKEKEYELMVRQEVENNGKEQKLARERKVQREKRIEAMAEAQRTELDKKYSKINSVIRKIHLEKHNTEKFKSHYESVKEIQHQDKLRYDNFVQKGIKDLEDRIAKKGQEDATKQKLERETHITFAKCNKLAGEEALQSRHAETQFSRSVGHRQSILLKSYQKRSIARTDDSKEKHLSFLKSSNKLQEELSARRMQPTPWSGLHAAHAHFAEQADTTLRECRHKRFARKVVDEYRRLHGLDATTLPVPNY